jgi:hypothetical protein
MAAHQMPTLCDVSATAKSGQLLWACRPPGLRRSAAGGAAAQGYIGEAANLTRGRPAAVAGQFPALLTAPMPGLISFLKCYAGRTALVARIGRLAGRQSSRCAHSKLAEPNLFWDVKEQLAKARSWPVVWCAAWVLQANIILVSALQAEKDWKVRTILELRIERKRALQYRMDRLRQSLSEL